MMRIYLILISIIYVSYADITNTLKGEFSVKKGNAYYKIKIDTPKTRGITKLKLALLYDSSKVDTSNSLYSSLGNGFSLLGLSTISKCAQTLSSEKKDKSRNYNYCLDGEKLVLTNGNYGTDNSEYATEINKFAKIVKKTNSWSIETKEGLILHYERSFFNFSYKLSKINDMFSENEINISYNSSQLVKKISYLHNSIDFIYNDINKLKNITIKKRDVELYNYNMEYIKDGNHSYLSKLTKCYGDKCLKALEFSWNNSSLLSNISNERNENTDIEYSNWDDTSVYTSTKIETSSNNVQNQTKRKLVKSYFLLDGIGGKNRITFTYKNYLIDKERNKNSFELITKNELSTNKRIESIFRQDFPFQGLLKDEKIYDEGILLKHTINKYKDRNQLIRNANKIFYPQLWISNTKFYDFNTKDFLKEESLINHHYDNFGNITKRELRISTENNNEYSSKTINDSYKKIPSSWITKLNERSITHYNKENNTNRIVQNFKYTYYDTGVKKEEIVEPNDSKHKLKTYYEYDKYGNLVLKRISGRDIHTQYHKYGYDSDNINQIRITNNLGHKIFRTYNYRNQIKYIIDENNLKTSFEYDDYGRLIKEIKPDESYTIFSYYNSSDKILVSKFEKGVSSATYYDYFGKIIETQKKGLSKFIRQNFYYDKLGREVKSSTPYLWDDTPKYTVTTYDNSGQIKEISRPGRNNSVLTEKRVYEKFSLTEINSKNQEKTTKFDSLGQVKKVIDNEKTIYYSYDSLGNLKYADGNSMKYDKRGNKILMHDKNMGKWTYEYNVLGQVKKQTDAKGNSITFQYDELSRLSKKISKDGVIEYKYDLSKNGIGRVNKEITNKIEKEYFYNNKGQNYKIRTTLRQENRVYEKSFEFDSYGRISRIIEPNNLVLEYKYKNNHLESITTPRKDIKTVDIQKIVEGIKSVKNNNSDLKEALENFNKIAEYKAKINQYERILFIYDDPEAWSNNSRKDELENLKHIVTSLESFVLSMEKMSETYKMMIPEFDENHFENLLYFEAFEDDYLLELKKAYNNAKHSSGYSQSFESLIDSGNGYIRENPLVTLALDSLVIYEELLNGENIIYFGNENDIYSYYAKKLNKLENIVNHMDIYKELKDSKNVYFYKALEQDAFGRITKYLSGNGLETKKIYNNYGKDLTNISTSFGGGNKIRNLEYKYDNMNNLTYKRNHILNITANYSYDDINRLTDASIDTNDKNIYLDYNYDKNGNILYKSDIGTYEYDYFNPYAVKKISKNIDNVAFEKLNRNISKSNIMLQIYGYMDFMYEEYFNDGFDPLQVIKEKSSSKSDFFDKLEIFQEVYTQTLNENINLFREDLLILLKDNLEYAGLDEFNDDEIDKLLYPGDFYEDDKFSDYLFDIEDLFDSISRYSEIYPYSSNIDEIRIYNKKRISELIISIENLNSQLKDIETINLEYDTNGNMVKKGNRIFEYNAYNRVSKIIENDKNVSFEYDANLERYKKSSNGVDTYYIDKGYEEVRIGNIIKERKYFIYIEGKLLSVFSDKNSMYSVKYLHYDNLNSVDTITDGFGNVEERFEYKPFGDKLNLNKDGKQTNKLSLITNRGYTGHEHVEEFDDIIHMNGRVYDSQIARFTSADPIIPYVFDTQSFNRYSYTRNNPLKYIDPNGFTDNSCIVPGDEECFKLDPITIIEDMPSFDIGFPNFTFISSGSISSPMFDLGSVDIVAEIDESNNINKDNLIHEDIKYKYEDYTPWERMKHSWNKFKLEKVGNSIHDAYKNSHPAMKTITVIAVAPTVSVLSVSTVESGIVYAYANPLQVMGFIEGFNGKGAVVQGVASKPQNIGYSIRKIIGVLE